MYLFLDGISTGEVLLIVVFILMFFGSKSIPGMARTFGRTLRQIRDATDDIKRDIRNSTSDIEKDLKQTKKTLEDSVRKTSQIITDNYKNTESDLKNVGSEFNKSLDNNLSDPVKKRTPILEKNDDKTIEFVENEKVSDAMDL
jgi:sec-independent protein translocase protein TatA